jgi:hypothetical protein
MKEESGISPFNRNTITPEARVSYRVSAYWNENSQEDDPILYIQYMPHCTVACNAISPSVNSGDQKTQNFDKARDNSDDNCTCCLCRWNCTYYLTWERWHLLITFMRWHGGFHDPMEKTPFLSTYE